MQKERMLQTKVMEKGKKRGSGSTCADVPSHLLVVDQGG